MENSVHFGPLGFNKLIREDHPPIRPFIPQLKKAEALAQLKISGQDHGLQKKKRKKYMYINQSKRLNSIMDDYDPYKKTNYE